MIDKERIEGDLHAKKALNRLYEMVEKENKEGFEIFAPLMEEIEDLEKKCVITQKTIDT